MGQADPGPSLANPGPSLADPGPSLHGYTTAYVLSTIAWFLDHRMLHILVFMIVVFSVMGVALVYVVVALQLAVYFLLNLGNCMKEQQPSWTTENHRSGYRMWQW